MEEKIESKDDLARSLWSHFYQRFFDYMNDFVYELIMEYEGDDKEEYRDNLNEWLRKIELDIN
jgi:uncharacterized protein YutE (UPF0331/DUF86 family)